MKIKIDKIPSIFKNVKLGSEVYLSSEIVPKEGAIVLVEAGPHDGKNNVLEHIGGRLGRLWQWDKIPAVLGFRKATVEFAGFIPSSLSPGSEAYLLCESGVVGAISGVYEAWGRPLKVKVLGSITSAEGRQLNLKNYRLKPSKNGREDIPIIVFLGTRMDCGKTTMACKITHELSALGKKIVAVKLTGVAFSQDLAKLTDAGADKTFDFVDMGLPSTCNGNPGEIVDSALDLIGLARSFKPDCIMVEFGDAVLGEYHVADILKNTSFRSKIKYIVLAANDLSGIKGTKDILEGWGMSIDLITGPIANSKIGIELVRKYFHLSAESNQHQIPKTIEWVTHKLFSKKV